MTTIAASLEYGYMAADTLTSAGDMAVSRKTKKIYRARGSLLGCAGNSAEGVLFREWFKNGAEWEKRPKLDAGFVALVLSKDGLYLYYDDCVALRGERGEMFDAIGSGMCYAKTAMYLGCTPKEAVKVAMHYDLGTGGTVRTVRL